MRAVDAALPAMEMSFLGNSLDRQSTRRGDKAYLASLLDRPDTDVVLSTPRTLVFPAGSPLKVGHTLDAALPILEPFAKRWFS